MLGNICKKQYSLKIYIPMKYQLIYLHEKRYIGYQRFFSRAAGIFGVGRRLFALVTVKTWQKPETALARSLAPRVEKRCLSCEKNKGAFYQNQPSFPCFKHLNMCMVPPKNRFLTLRVALVCGTGGQFACACVHPLNNNSVGASNLMAWNCNSQKITATF